MENEIVKRIASSGRGTIQMPDEEPLDFMRVRMRLRGIAHYIDGFTSDNAPDGMVTRKNPFTGDYGRIDFNDACTQAAIRCMIEAFGPDEWPPEMIYYFLNPSRIGLSETPYIEKIGLVGKIIKEFQHRLGRNETLIRTEGDILDPKSSFIVNCESTDLFWLKSGYCNNNYEFLMSTTLPETKFLLTQEYDFCCERGEKTLFTKLKEIHKKENLFSKGPINFTRHLAGGWHIPVLGVTEIIGIFPEPNDFKIKTTLSKKGVEVEEIEGEIKYGYSWLRP